jgi:hypothetical protein
VCIYSSNFVSSLLDVAKCSILANLPYFENIKELMGLTGDYLTVYVVYVVYVSVCLRVCMYVKTGIK